MKRKQTNFAKFGSWLRKQNTIVFVAVLLIVIYLLGTVLSTPFEQNWISDVRFFPDPADMGLPVVAMFFMAVIVAPLLETALFQALPFWIFYRFATFRQHRWIMVLIMALIFGSQHYYTVSYILITTGIGAVLMYAYIIKWQRHAYWNVVALHAIWNAIAFTAAQLGFN